MSSFWSHPAKYKLDADSTQKLTSSIKVKAAFCVEFQQRYPDKSHFSQGYNSSTDCLIQEPLETFLN